MGISLSEQGIVFLFSILVGGLLGAFYDVFRILRIAFPSGWFVVFIQDLLYCAIATMTVLIFIFYANSGQVRWFALCGALLAFIFYYMTIGKFIMFISRKIIDFIKKLLKFLYSITVKPLLFIIKFVINKLIRLVLTIISLTKKAAEYILFLTRRKKYTTEAKRGFRLVKNTRINKKYINLIKTEESEKNGKKKIKKGNTKEKLAR